MRMRKALLLLVLLLVGCRNDQTGSSADAGPVIAFGSGRSAISLDRALALLENELTKALANPGAFGAHLDRAETISDRLFETQMPFPWLIDSAYGVEPMLRQIQALADRIVAERRSGFTENTQQMIPDTRDLLKKVQGLRVALRGKGGAAPLSLDSILARYASDSLMRLVDAGE
jgi:hypothetical protein